MSKQKTDMERKYEIEGSIAIGVAVLLFLVILAFIIKNTIS